MSSAVQKHNEQEKQKYVEGIFIDSKRPPETSQTTILTKG